MRLHVIALPHTQTTRKYLHCAYTQKVVKFCDMMSAQGHEVVLYSGEENEATCAEHVELVSEAWRVEHFGEWDENGLFGNVDWNSDHPTWQTFNARANEELVRRAEPHDVLCLVMGWSQYPLVLQNPGLMPVEWAVGYEGIVPDLHHVFESYAWMHHVYGKKGIGDGRAFDTVIPNFFDPADFPLGDGSGGYLVFLGRIVRRKGPHVAAQIADRAGYRLLVAGPGAIEWRTARRHGKGWIGAPEIALEGRWLEYVGPVGLRARAELLANAAAIVVPTQYIEPFGGVAVEAMMCGTPVVASDFGAFVETVEEGVSGYRFRTLREGAEAVRAAVQLDRARVRDYALERYSLQAVGPRFSEHFARLDTLWRDGWYE